MRFVSDRDRPSSRSRSPDKRGSIAGKPPEIVHSDSVAFYTDPEDAYVFIDDPLDDRH
ncbi:MAG: hypothetical protein ACP5D4_02305 [Baaleninema sp.]